MPSALDILSAEYRTLVETIAISGWTIPLNIDIHCFNELKEIMGDAGALDMYFSNYLRGREFSLICRKIVGSIDNPAQRNAFIECKETYDAELYSVCITTLISVLEGVISTFGDDPQDVRIMRICSFKAGEEIRNKKNIKSLCWLSMYEFVRNLFSKSDFSQPEPDMINRHWIQHGRTSHTVEAIDCLRVFNALSTMASIKQFKPMR